MSVEVKVLGPDDGDVLSRVAAGVFDYAVDPDATREFLADPRHHIVVALEHGTVVGFASGLHYVHPDKPAPELWINEVAVAPSHRRQGVATAILHELFAFARRLGCAEAWVLTEPDDDAALGLYTAAGGQSQEQVMFSFRL